MSSRRQITEWETERRAVTKLAALPLDRVGQEEASMGVWLAAHFWRPRPLEEWCQDGHPSALWWKFPVVEPPYCGSPLCEDWPGYHTHWTPIPTPLEPSWQPPPDPPAGVALEPPFAKVAHLAPAADDFGCERFIRLLSGHGLAVRTAGVLARMSARLGRKPIGELDRIERRTWLLQRNCGPTTADEIDRFFGRAA